MCSNTPAYFNLLPFSSALNCSQPMACHSAYYGKILIQFTELNKNLFTPFCTWWSALWHCTTPPLGPIHWWKERWMIYESESPPMPLRVCLGWVATGQEDTTRNRHCTALHFRPILIRSVVKNQLPSPRSATRLHDPGHQAFLFCPFPDASWRSHLHLALFQFRRRRIGRGKREVEDRVTEGGSLAAVCKSYRWYGAL